MDIHALIDEQLAIETQVMEKALRDGDTTKFIEVWSGCVETGMLAMANMSGAEANMGYKGHGQFHLEDRQVPHSGRYDKQQHSMTTSN